jgi:mevalonate kinase
MITVIVPAKIHLMGEYSAIYGEQTLLAAVGRSCTITITEQEEKEITINSKNLGKTERFALDSIIEQTEKARALYSQFVASRDPLTLKAIIHDPLHYLALAIGETVLFYQKKQYTGFTLTVDSTIPMNFGMGSSAAVAVAVVKAVSQYLGQSPDNQTICNISTNIEKNVHGFPSGGDVAAVCYGGTIVFQKDAEGKKTVKSLWANNHSPLQTKDIIDHFILINTGSPQESTGEMVSSVRELEHSHPEIIATFVKNQGNVTRNFIKALQDNDFERVLSLLREGEKNLESIHVVSPKTQNLIREIEQSGGGAKISGAGGKIGGSGIVVAMHSDPQMLKDIVTKYNFSFLLL